MSHPALVFWYAMITALATGFGAVPFAFTRALSPAGAAWANAVASGLMLGASFGLVAEGPRYGPTPTVVGSTAGVLFILLTQHLLERYEVGVGPSRDKGARRMALMIVVMTVHSFSEGVAVGVSFGGGTVLAIAITIAIAVHNVPEGLAISAVLRPRGVSVLGCAAWSVFSSLPQPLMAVPAYLFVETVRPALPASRTYGTRIVLADGREGSERHRGDGDEHHDLLPFVGDAREGGNGGAHEDRNGGDLGGGGEESGHRGRRQRTRRGGDGRIRRRRRRRPLARGLAGRGLVGGGDARALAAAVMDPNEYLNVMRRDGRLDTGFRSTPGKIRYHVPCHLRAQNIGYRSRDMMRAISEDTEVELVAECCGHDGTWAMKREFFPLSLEAGRKAFAGMQGDGLLTTDCPLAAIQFEQATGVRPLHPLQVLDRAYRADGFPQAVAGGSSAEKG